MTERTCTIEDCEKKHRSRGYCLAHYNRLRVHGDPMGGRQRPPIVCTIEGCEKPYFGVGLCAMHYTRLRKHGDPLVQTRRGDGKPFGALVTYRTAHERVERAKGKAAGYVCACGAPAADWAYDHADPAEWVDSKGHSYSGDPAHYAPTCRSCHTKLDRWKGV